MKALKIASYLSATELKNKVNCRKSIQDKARFGKIYKICSCWVPHHDRALVFKQIIRQYTYLYSAICPETGEQFSMILPYANSECMAIFLEEFSKQFSDYRVIMVMDNASWRDNERQLKKFGYIQD
ncbi:MAG: hypothetical protein LBC68_08365 [Prevotellaceae bacterium]|jgi:hypothetical protein|nr:hypothetical protein [Prevotellaceae bacterium]